MHARHEMLVVTVTQISVHVLYCINNSLPFYRIAAITAWHKLSFCSQRIPSEHQVDIMTLGHSSPIAYTYSFTIAPLLRW